MARVRRTKIQRERDRALTANMYLRGMSQYEIAAALNARDDCDYTLTQQSISYDLKAVRNRWRDASIRDFDELKAQELAKIDQLEREYWDAWERSKKPKQRQRGTKDGVKSVSKESRDGNPSFLMGVERCIERRCKILGIDAPTRMELQSIDFTALSTAQLEALAQGTALAKVLLMKEE